MAHPDTSWENVSLWYEDITTGGGHYYHRHVIMPGIQKLWTFHPYDNLLDIGCGTGVFSRHIPKQLSYVGIDASKSLIDIASKADKNPNHTYICADATKPLPVSHDFTHAAFILSLQNMKDQKKAIEKAGECLTKRGQLLIVLNHPCFRIPRQTNWEIDPKNKIQYRRINRYLSPLAIPISMHPGKHTETTTWSYHFPLVSYSTFLRESGFVITHIEEWISDKVSVGSAAHMENRAREEFPLFLAIVGEKG